MMNICRDSHWRRIRVVAVVPLVSSLLIGCNFAARNISEGILQEQAAAWNSGDIDGFMSHYWKSPNLSFSSGGDTTYGWQATRDRFAERYPDAATMGELTFELDDARKIDDKAVLALGRWHLKRSAEGGGPVGGNFSLFLKRFATGWKIVHDHTSVKENDE